MSTITREQAQKIIEAADEVITALAGTNEDVHPESDNMLRLWDDLNDRYAPPEVVRELARIALPSLEAEAVGEFYYEKQGGWYQISEGDKVPDNRRIKLYTAPPAPVSVPDEIEPTVEAIKHVLPTSNPDEYAACIGADMWNACRAAMLHGADGNSTVVPDGWVLVPVDATRAMIDAAARAEVDGYDAMHKAMIAAAPQQEVNP